MKLRQKLGRWVSLHAYLFRFRVIARLILGFLGLCFGIGAAEILVRLTHKELSLDRFQIENWPNAHWFRPSTILPHEAVPNGYHGVNSLGFRDREHLIKKPAGVSRIILLGDSIPMYATFPDLLEENLERLYPGKYEIWNCAVGGYSIREYAILAKEKMPRYSPDAVVISFCMNDITDRTRILYFDGKGNLNAYAELPGIIRPIDRILYLKSYLYRYWLQHYRFEGEDSGYRIRLDEANRAMGIIVSEAAKMRVPIVAIVFPYLMKPAEWTTEQRSERKQILDLLNRYRISYLDLYGVFPWEKIESFRKAPRDDVHINARGDDVVVPVITDFLRAQGLIPGAEDGRRSPQ